MTNALAMLAILALHVLCQPYTKRAYNVIDMLLFTDLILIKAISFYSYHRNHYQLGIKPSITASIVVQLMLIYLPLIVISVYVLVMLCNKVISWRATNSLLMKANVLIPDHSAKLRDSNEEEFTHSRQMDEYIDFSSTYKYFRASSDLEIA